MATQGTKPRVLFLIVGILLLVIAYVLTEVTKRNEFWPSTLRSVALIALTVVIVEFLWSIVGGDPVKASIIQLQNTLAELRVSIQLLDDSHKTGLRRIFSASGAAGSSQDWMNRLKVAGKYVDLMGHSLHVWTKGEHFEKTLVQLAGAGVHIRVLIMAPDNPELTACINYRQIKGITLDSIREEIKASLQAFKAIAAALTGTPSAANLQLRVLKGGLIFTQICRTDSTLTSIQYLYSAVASRTPLLEVTGEDSELFQQYMREFDQIWALAIPA